MQTIEFRLGYAVGVLEALQVLLLAQAAQAAQLKQAQTEPRRYADVEVINPLPADAPLQLLKLPTRVLNKLIKNSNIMDTQVRDLRTIADVLSLDSDWLVINLRDFAGGSLRLLDIHLAQAGHRRVNSTLE